MKKIIKNNLLCFVLGMLVCGGIVYAASYKADDISYIPTDESWEVNNVNDALNSLYNISLNASKVKTGSYKPTALTWTEFDIGFRPKYFIFYTVGHDTSGTAIPLKGSYIEGVYNGIDGRYVVLTDIGFKHNPVQASLIRNATFWWVAATDE